MFLYNITYSIDHNVEQEWLEWMKRIYLQKIMATGYFLDIKMYKLIKAGSEEITYSVQLFSDRIGKVQDYLEKEAPLLAEELNHRYRHKHVAFRTLLQEIDLRAGLT